MPTQTDPFMPTGTDRESIAMLRDTLTNDDLSLMLMEGDCPTFGLIYTGWRLARRGVRCREDMDVVNTAARLLCEYREPPVVITRMAQLEAADTNLLHTIQSFGSGAVPDLGTLAQALEDAGLYRCGGKGVG